MNEHPYYVVKYIDDKYIDQSPALTKEEAEDITKVGAVLFPDHVYKVVPWNKLNEGNDYVVFSDLRPDQ